LGNNSQNQTKTEGGLAGRSTCSTVSGEKESGKQLQPKAHERLTRVTLKYPCKTTGLGRGLGAKTGIKWKVKDGPRSKRRGKILAQGPSVKGGKRCTTRQWAKSPEADK